MLAKVTSSYLIFLGASGLVVIFAVIFCDLYGKDVFLGRVWFELLWVSLFLIMELAGAAAITAQSNSQTCSSTFSNLLVQVSPCAPTQVLQAFTWICAILFLGYYTLLFISAIVKYRDDHTIWRRSVRNFPWLSSHRSSKNLAASSALPRFHTQVPIIVAPRPRRIINIREPVLSYRSGLGLDYEIEHYQPTTQAEVDLDPSADNSISPLPSTLPVTVSPTRILQPQQVLQKPGSTVSTPFYPTHVQTAISPGLQLPSTAYLGQARRAPSPPPLGEWPRRDAISQPARVKRQPVTRNLPPPPEPYSFTTPAALRQRQPPATLPIRSRPSGPRLRSNSGENLRPPNVDLSSSLYSSRGYI